MEINKLQDDLNHILDILDPYINITGKDYISNSSIRSFLISIHEPVNGLSDKIKQIIIKEKLNSLGSDINAEEKKRLAGILGLDTNALNS